MSSPRIPVKRQILEWAENRSMKESAEILNKFPKFDEWKSGTTLPTLKQLEGFARFTYVPFGYLLLSDPPVEELPIPDFRVQHNYLDKQASPNLLDTIYLCQQRQEWYKSYKLRNDEQTLKFVGSANLDDDIIELAEEIRNTLGLDLREIKNCPTWTESLKKFAKLIEEAGVLVMCSGVVGSNSHRKLDPSEFRGFSLADPIAPLVFINASDSKAAQMFTLAHELAHIWLGSSGLTDVPTHTPNVGKTEKWCNKLAAEILVPEKEIAKELRKLGRKPLDCIDQLCKRFKVSSFVIIRRLYGLNYISSLEYQQRYAIEEKRMLKTSKASSGNFYHTLIVRTGRKFAKALIASTLEGETLFRDAYQFLGIKKTTTFNELARSLELL